MVNLKGQTNLGELAELARGARFVIGNDTGPMHVAAVAGANCLALFSSSSDPVLCAPYGKVTTIRRDKLSDLKPDEVIAWIKKQL